MHLVTQIHSSRLHMPLAAAVVLLLQPCLDYTTTSPPLTHTVPQAWFYRDVCAAVLDHTRSPVTCGCRCWHMDAWPTAQMDQHFYLVLGCTARPGCLALALALALAATNAASTLH
ncbi:hypothetical protein V8C86DRAFT_2646677 [Haematococcus lacustris]